MGLSLTWLAVQNIEPLVIHEKLELHGTGIRGDVLTVPLVGGKTTSGWYIIMANCCDHPLFTKMYLTKVSSNCYAVLCSLEEHVMYSASTAWIDGSEAWSVVHRGGDYGVFDLNAKGQLPEVYLAIRDRLFAEQKNDGDKKAGVDFVFDIPVVLAEIITGYQLHNSDKTDVPEGWEILEWITPLGKYWWRKLCFNSYSAPREIPPRK